MGIRAELQELAKGKIPAPERKQTLVFHPVTSYLIN
jgi:hypothetical protein